MKFAKYAFSIAGIYGILVMLPQYFLEEKNGREFPPPVNHPEYYYGFIGVVLAWQILFLILAKNPVRYRAMMIPAILEKFGFTIAVTILYLQHRVGTMIFGFGMIDLVLGVSFVISYILCAEGAHVSKGARN